MPQNAFDWRLVQVMAWCHQATSHYLNQCWWRSMSPYNITWLKWVKGSTRMCLSFRLQFIAVYEVSGPASTGTVLVFHYVPLQAFCVSCGPPIKETKLGSAAGLDMLLAHKFYHFQCWMFLGKISKYICISYHFSALGWHRQWKFFPRNDNTLVILHSQHHGC